MLRQLVLIAVGFALIVPLTAGGCKDGKSDVPKIKDAAPKDGPKRMIPGAGGGPGGKSPPGPKGKSE